jgi:hypothetical protein
MIDIRPINEKYQTGREKPGGKVYVIGPNDAQIASYSGFTRTLEWYQPVSEEEKTLIETYLKENC